MVADVCCKALMVFRCRTKDSKSRNKVPSSPYSDKFDSSSADEGDQDENEMLHIPVESDDEIKVRSVDSDSSASESQTAAAAIVNVQDTHIKLDGA